MGYFKELEIEKMAAREKREQIRFDVALRVGHLRETQAQLRSIRRHNRQAVGVGQCSLLLYDQSQKASGF